MTDSSKQAGPKKGEFIAPPPAHEADEAKDALPVAWAEVARYPPPMIAAVASNKFQRYRQRRRALGLKEVRLWIPDPAAPGFREEIARQAASLRGAAEEAEIMAFVDAAWDDIEAGILAEEAAAPRT